MADVQTEYEEPVLRLEQYSMGSASTVELQVKPSRITRKELILVRRPIANLVALK